MKATLKGNILTLEVPLTEARASSTGKTLLVANLHGNTGASLNIPQIGKRDINVSANFFVYPTEKKAA